MLSACTHSSAFSPSLGFKISVWSPVKISNAFGMFLAPLDTLTDLIWLMSILALDPLQLKCAPLNVKYLVRHLLKSLHLPFFSFNCPSITGCVLFSRNPMALSGFLHKKHPHCCVGSSSRLLELLIEVPISKTSKNPLFLSSFSKVSCSFGWGKALVTNVMKVLFSNFKVSQQCLRLETLGSQLLKAFEARDCRSKNIKWIQVFAFLVRMLKKVLE